MKQMVYNRKNKKELKEVLDWDKWHNYEYVILNLHTHPCAYICLTKDDIYNQKHYNEIPVETHGGLTFAEPILYRVKQYSDKYKCDINTSIRKDWIIGWDYNHYQDYNSMEGYGHRYTTKEMLDDVHYVIKQLAIDNLKDGIIEEIHEECDYDEYGGISIPSLDDLDDIMGQVFINGQRIETMNDNDYYFYLDILKKEILTDGLYMHKLENLIHDYKHPYSDWDNCDADFYGV